MTQEEISRNFTKYINRTKQYGFNIDGTNRVYKPEALMNAPWEGKNDNGRAYDGSMLEIVLTILVPTALKINELLPENLQVDKEQIIKVLLFQHISKMMYFEKNDNQWEVEKRGMVYKFREELPALKTGTYSYHIATELGVKFSVEEFEAMISIDRGDDDKQAKFYSNPLSTIIKQANELTYLIIRYN